MANVRKRVHAVGHDSELGRGCIEHPDGLPGLRRFGDIPHNVGIMWTMHYLALGWRYRKALVGSLRLISEAVDALKDGKMTTEERSGLMSRWWAVVEAAKQA